jgi:hypothetical protein
MDSKTSCINYPELEAVMIELIGDGTKTLDLLHELVSYLEEHGCECIDGKSGYFIDR